jgi:uncharacterized protein (TIGR02246 family)
MAEVNLEQMKERTSGPAPTSTQEDEQKIRDLIATWQRASAAGDLPQVLDLMAEDVVFLVAGHPPMRGRDAFAEAFRKAGMQQFRLESKSEIQEIQITGDWAYFWSHLSVTMTPKSGGSPMRRAGYTLTILRKKPDGEWLVARDANMLTEQRSTFE